MPVTVPDQVRDPQQSTSNAQMESNLSFILEAMREREGGRREERLAPCSVIRPQNRPSGNVRGAQEGIATPAISR